MKTAWLNVQGMTCGHCALSVEKALRNRDGVRSAKVHLDDGAAEVEFEETRVSPEQLVAVVQDEGYTADIA
ncbi:MAG TPA: cation transporter [Longimicrobium sp.]|nr:cation transporter [Longimicrobium sp.]